MEDLYTITIRGEQLTDEYPPDTFELITDGSYRHSKAFSRISYRDTDPDYFGPPIETVFKVFSSKVKLRRDSWEGAEMIIDERKKEHFLFPMIGGGSILLGVQANFIRKNLNENGGDLTFKYTLDYNNQKLSESIFDINIKPREVKH